MRTLLGLTVLMVMLAAAVWWKTSESSGSEELPPTRSEDPNEGILTFGLDEESESGVQDAGAGGGGTATDAGLRPPPRKDESGAPAESDGAQGARKQDAPAQSERPAEEPPAAEELPAGPAADLEPEEDAPLRHTVRQGENLYRIVLQAYGTAPKPLVEAVAEANDMQDAAALSAGAVLVLPRVSGYPAPSQP